MSLRIQICNTCAPPFRRRCLPPISAFWQYEHGRHHEPNTRKINMTSIREITLAAPVRPEDYEECAERTRMTKFNCLGHLRIVACMNLIVVIHLIRLEWVRHSCAVCFFISDQMVCVQIPKMEVIYLSAFHSHAADSSNGNEQLAYAEIHSQTDLLCSAFSFVSCRKKRNSVDGSWRGTIILVSLWFFFVHALFP